MKPGDKYLCDGQTFEVTNLTVSCDAVQLGGASEYKHQITAISSGYQTGNPTINKQQKTIKRSDIITMMTATMHLGRGMEYSYLRESGIDKTDFEMKEIAEKMLDKYIATHINE